MGLIANSAFNLKGETGAETLEAAAERAAGQIADDLRVVFATDNAMILRQNSGLGTGDSLALSQNRRLKPITIALEPPSSATRP